MAEELRSSSITEVWVESFPRECSRPFIQDAAAMSVELDFLVMKNAGINARCDLIGTVT